MTLDPMQIGEGLKTWPYLADFGGIQNGGAPLFRYLGVEGDGVFDMPGIVAGRDVVMPPIVSGYDGTRELFGSDEPAIVPHCGVKNWQRRNNNVRHGRDATNSAWEKTDLVAEAGPINDIGLPCSRLTATADGGSISQSTVSGSAVKNFGAHGRFRKVSGSGVCRISCDDGATPRTLALPDDGAWLDHCETLHVAGGVADTAAKYRFELQNSGDVVEFDEPMMIRTGGRITFQPYIDQGAGPIGLATRRDAARLQHELLQDGLSLCSGLACAIGFWLDSGGGTESGTMFEISDGTINNFVRMNHRADASIYYAQKGETSKGGGQSKGNDPQKIPQIPTLIDPATGKPCIYGMQPGMFDLMIVSHRYDPVSDQFIRRIGTSFYVDPATGLSYHENIQPAFGYPSLTSPTLTFTNDIADSNPFSGSLAFAAIKPGLFADNDQFTAMNGGIF